MTAQSGYVSEHERFEAVRKSPVTTQQVQDFINRVAGVPVTVGSGGAGGSVHGPLPAYEYYQMGQGLPEVTTTDSTEIRHWHEGPLAGRTVIARPLEQLTQAQRERFRDLDAIAIASQSRPKPQPVIVAAPEPVDFLHPKPRAIEL